MKVGRGRGRRLESCVVRALWVRDGILIMRRTENSGRPPGRRRQMEIEEGVGKRVLEREFEGEVGQG